MSNTLKISGPIRVGRLTSDPASPENGLIYYNTTTNTFKQYKNGSFVTVTDSDTVAALTATDIAFAKSDGTKKNIQAASDDLEAAVDDLDEAIGALAATPTNYTPGDATKVASHLTAVDTALASAGGTEFADDVFRVKGSVDATKKVAIEADGIATATTRTITMPNVDVDLAEVGDQRTLSGTSFGDTDLGTFTGTTIPDTQNVKQALQSLETKAENNTSIINNFEWQASAKDYVTDNTAVPATEVSDDRYILSHDGGAPNAAWDGAAAGDIVEFNGTSWVATTPATGAFISVDDDGTGIYQWGGAAWAFKNFEATTASTGLTKSGFDIRIADVNTGGINATSGALSVNVDDSTVEKGAAAGNPLQVKDSGITNAKVATGIDAAKLADGTVSNAELQYINSLTSNAQTQLDGKLANVVEDLTPQLGGNLDVNGKSIEDASNEIVIAGANSVQRAKQASKTDFIEEEYIHGIALSASQTNTIITDLTFAHATFEGLEITYKLKEATSNNVSIGTIRVVTNGTNIVLNDMSTETADLGVTFDAVVNGANVNIRYTSDTNAVTMRADVKKIKA